MIHKLAKANPSSDNTEGQRNRETEKTDVNKRHTMRSFGIGKNNGVLMICGMLVTLWLVLYEYSRRKVEKKENFLQVKEINRGIFSVTYPFGSGRIPKGLNVSLSFLNKPFLHEDDIFDNTNQSKIDLSILESEHPTYNLYDLNKKESWNLDGVLVVKIAFEDPKERPIIDPIYFPYDYNTKHNTGFEFKWFKDTQGSTYEDICKRILYQLCNKRNADWFNFELIALDHTESLDNQYTRKLNHFYCRSKHKFKIGSDLNNFKKCLYGEESPPPPIAPPTITPPTQANANCDNIKLIYRKTTDTNFAKDLKGYDNEPNTEIRDITLLIKNFDDFIDPNSPNYEIYEKIHTIFGMGPDYNNDDLKKNENGLPAGRIIQITRSYPRYGIYGLDTNIYQGWYVFFSPDNSHDEVVEIKSVICTACGDCGWCHYYTDHTGPTKKKLEKATDDDMKNLLRNFKGTFIAKCYDRDERWQLPQPQPPPPSTPTVTYNWKEEDNWNRCSEDCGGGTQTREVPCIGSDGVQVANEMCTEVMPVTTRMCNEQDCITYSWKEEDSWSSCSKDCGGGIQTREVPCIGSNGVKVDNIMCTGRIPTTQRECNTPQCTNYNWREGEWGECSNSKDCGPGERTRTVSCYELNTDQEVGYEFCNTQKPTITERCDKGPCIEYNWREGGWDKDCPTNPPCDTEPIVRNKVFQCFGSNGEPAEDNNCSGMPPSTPSPCPPPPKCKTCIPSDLPDCGNRNRIISNLDEITKTLRWSNIVKENDQCKGMDYGTLDQKFVPKKGTELITDKNFSPDSNLEVFCKGEYTWESDKINCRLNENTLDRVDFHKVTPCIGKDTTFQRSYNDGHKKPENRSGLLFKNDRLIGETNTKCQNTNYPMCDRMNECNIKDKITTSTTLYAEFIKEDHDVKTYWNNNELVQALDSMDITIVDQNFRDTYLDGMNLIGRICLNVTRTSMNISDFNKLKSCDDAIRSYWSEDQRKKFEKLTNNAVIQVFNQSQTNNYTVSPTNIGPIMDSIKSFINNSIELKYLVKDENTIEHIEITKAPDCAECKSLTHYQSMSDTLNCLYGKIGVDGKLDFTGTNPEEQNKYWEENMRCAKMWDFNFRPNSNGVYCKELLKRDNIEVNN